MKIHLCLATCIKKKNRLLSLKSLFLFSLLFTIPSVYLSAVSEPSISSRDNRLAIQSPQQNKKNIRISGTVYDKEKITLPGVTIRVISESNTTGVMTDLDGHFYLNVPDQNSVIEVSYIGFKSQQIRVGDKINFDIFLEEDITTLEEVVVTGYGSQKRASIIGAIETLEPAKLQTGSTRSMSNNLAGQIAGVIAVRRSGEPGYDNSSFWIRGISTFSGSKTPLVLVDGVERDLNQIDPAEIESFSILKDASASAMYGVRGANGVIVINTKRGKIGVPTVNFRIEHSIMEPTKLPDYIGAADYMTLLNKLSSDQERLPYSQDRIDKTRSGYDKDLYPDVNWIDEITKDYAYSTRANLTVNGGSDFLRYVLIASYFNEQGILENDRTLTYNTGIKLDRYNVRANIDVDITKTTTLRLNIGGYMQERRGPKNSVDVIFEKAFGQTPFAHPARYSDGTVPDLGVSGSYNNPWGYATQYGYGITNDSQIQSLFAVEQNLKMITQGLKAKATFSFDSYSWSGRERAADRPIYSVATGRDEEGNLITNVLSYGDDALGLWSGGKFGNKRTYLEGTLTYDRAFGKHDIDALFLYNQQSYDDGGVQPYRKQGVAGRLSYMFDSRYITEFNFGYNGSENFAKGKRFGFFPSIAVGWLLSEEPFMATIKNTLNKLKLRASYGKVGNDNIGGRRFAYITTVNNSVNGFQWGETGQYARSGITDGELGVADLTWETAWKTNLGVEFGLWSSLNLQVDAFREKRSNIFMQRSTIPTQAGFSTFPWANYGKVKNEGIEFSLNYDKTINKDWQVGFRSTFTYAKNTIEEIDEPAGRLGTHRSQTGLSMNTLWGLTAERLFTDEDFDAAGNLLSGIPTQSVGATIVRPGDIKYVDRNNDGVITEDDEGYIGGTVDPRIVYGFGGNLVYRNWDLNFFFQGIADTYRIIGNTMYFIPGSSRGLGGNVFSNYEDAWSEENPSQDVFWPRLSETANQQNYRASTWWKKDMSFLRCKTIELGYSLPKSVLERVGGKSIRVYVSGNNLFYISKFKLWDPELSTNRGDKYPQMRSVMFGVDINF